MARDARERPGSLELHCDHPMTEAISPTRSLSLRANSDLQFLEAIVDDQGMQQTQHVHADQNRGLVFEFPDFEHVHVAVDNVDVGERDISELNFSSPDRFASLLYLSESDHSGDGRRLGKLLQPNQLATQCTIAQGALRSCIDDCLDLHAADSTCRQQ